MENEHVIAGLIRKRAEIAGHLEAAQATVRQLVIDIDNVDATIRLFAPDTDLAAIRPKPFPPRHSALKGDLARSILTVMRTASGPLTTGDLALQVMAERGLNAADPRLAQTVRMRVAVSLRNLRVRGTVRSETDGGRNMRWALAGP